MTKRHMPAVHIKRPNGVRVFADTTRSPEAQLKDLTVQLKDVTDGLKAFAEKAEKEIKASGAISEEVKAKADELLAKQSDLDGRISALEQKLVRAPGAADRPRSIGEIVTGNDQVKDFCARQPRGSVKIDIAASISSAPASAGDLVAPDRQPGIIMPAQRRFTIRQLLSPGRTGSNLVEYVKETGFTNNAAPVTETTEKPESNITFDLVNAPVRTIAHFVDASRQILSDAAQLESYIDGRLRYGLEYKEELHLLLGDGTGQNLNGLVPQASAYSAAFTPSLPSLVDTLRLALLQVTLAEYPADGIVLNPTDWARIELLKDTTGNYVWSNPQQMGGPVLWGRPVVETQAMTEDEFLVGAFRLGGQVYDRENATVEISTENKDNFVKNMVTILCEERIALAVYRPEAFVTGDFGNVT